MGKNNIYNLSVTSAWSTARLWCVPHFCYILNAKEQLGPLWAPLTRQCCPHILSSEIIWWRTNTEGGTEILSNLQEHSAWPLESWSWPKSPDQSPQSFGYCWRHSCHIAFTVQAMISHCWAMIAFIILLLYVRLTWTSLWSIFFFSWIFSMW